MVVVVGFHGWVGRFGTGNGQIGVLVAGFRDGWVGLEQGMGRLEW